MVFVYKMPATLSGWRFTQGMSELSLQLSWQSRMKVLFGREILLQTIFPHKGGSWEKQNNKKSPAIWFWFRLLQTFWKMGVAGAFVRLDSSWMRRMFVLVQDDESDDGCADGFNGYCWVEQPAAFHPDSGTKTVMQSMLSKFITNIRWTFITILTYFQFELFNNITWLSTLNSQLF